MSSTLKRPSEELACIKVIELLVKRIQPEFPKLQEEGGRATFNPISGGGDQGLKLCAIVRSTYIVHRA